MPELPDITVYIEALEARILGKKLKRIRLGSPFLLRTVSPSPDQLYNREVVGIKRLGKRIVIEFDGGLFLVLHLMIAGRLQWDPAGASRKALATFEFSSGTLQLTEAGSRKRASLHIVEGQVAVRALAPEALEVLDASLAEFRQRLTSENHTVKRSLTDPHLFSGIGNAYSDEILHRARLSPVKLTSRLTDEEIETLYEATRSTLIDWTDRLRTEAKGEFPMKVTAFRKGMAVHGRYGQACPVCGTAVQRIVHAENETNYCARCQTGGKLLADRALSRLLKSDWPRSIDEL
jgi:formamidopyrimidine-DNA glycosylase